MTNHTPKYQHSAIVAKRQSKGNEFKFQQMKKNGEWGAVRTGNDKLYYKLAPQQILDKWEELNPDNKYRIVEA